MKKFIMYGAGNIGRGFIGQTFSLAGYKVGFIDVNMTLIDRLNADGEYPVDVVTTAKTEEIIVKNVYGIDGKDIELVSDEIASADIMATAIGVNVLKFIAKPIALGIKKRAEKGLKAFNIVICENLIGADEFLKGLILNEIPDLKEYVDQNIGFVEASIGRMVPVLAEEKKKGNPLRVAVEPYNILPVDKDAFKGEIPNVKNLYPYAPFNLFIQRKLFMHNMSHALTAYIGYSRNYEYIYEAIKDYDIKYCAYKALVSSATAVAKENGVEIKPLLDNAEDLIYRFSNVALGDTVERVGKDTKRKLSSNDRLIGALKLAEKHNVNASYLALGIAYGMHFNPVSDESSVELSSFAKEFGVKETLKKYSDYDGGYVQLIEKLYGMIADNKSLTDLEKEIESVNGKEIRV